MTQIIILTTQNKKNKYQVKLQSEVKKRVIFGSDKKLKQGIPNLENNLNLNKVRTS